MSEEFESTEIDTENVQTLSHKRIIVLMSLVVMILSGYGFAFISWQFGTGVLIGGIMSLINYLWLKNTLQTIFTITEEGEVPVYSASRYFMRYFAFGFVLLFVYLTKIVPITAVIFGLASFAFAIVFEGFIRIFTSFKK